MVVPITAGNVVKTKELGLNKSKKVKGEWKKV